MAIRHDITASDDFFIGEDKVLNGIVYERPDGLTDVQFAATIAAGTATQQNITGWSLSWMLKSSEGDADAAAKVTKTTGAGVTLLIPASGTYKVDVADTDTDALTPKTYRHELKRTNAGFESVITYGTCILKRGVHRS